MFPGKCEIWNVTVSSPGKDVFCESLNQAVICNTSAAEWIPPQTVQFNSVTSHWAGTYDITVTCDDNNVTFTGILCVYDKPSVKLVRMPIVDGIFTFWCIGTSTSQPKGLVQESQDMRYSWAVIDGNGVSTTMTEESDTLTLTPTETHEYVRIECGVTGKSHLVSDTTQVTADLKGFAELPGDAHCLMYPDHLNRDQNITLIIHQNWTQAECGRWQLSLILLSEETNDIDPIYLCANRDNNGSRMCSEDIISGNWWINSTITISNMTEEMVGVYDTVIECNNKTLYLPRLCVYNFPTVPRISVTDNGDELTYTCTSSPNSGKDFDEQVMYYNWMINDIDIEANATSLNDSIIAGSRLGGNNDNIVHIEYEAHKDVKNITCVATERGSNIFSTTSKMVNQTDMFKTILSTLIGALGIVIGMTVFYFWYSSKKSKAVGKTQLELDNPENVYRRGSGLYLAIDDTILPANVKINPALPPRDNTYSQPFEVATEVIKQEQWYEDLGYQQVVATIEVLKQGKGDEDIGNEQAGSITVSKQGDDGIGYEQADSITVSKQGDEDIGYEQADSITVSKQGDEDIGYEQADSITVSKQGDEDIGYEQADSITVSKQQNGDIRCNRTVGSGENMHPYDEPGMSPEYLALLDDDKDTKDDNGFENDESANDSSGSYDETAIPPVLILPDRGVTTVKRKSKSHPHSSSVHPVDGLDGITEMVSQQVRQYGNREEETTDSHAYSTLDGIEKERDPLSGESSEHHPTDCHEYDKLGGSGNRTSSEKVYLNTEEGGDESYVTKCVQIRRKHLIARIITLTKQIRSLKAKYNALLALRQSLLDQNKEKSSK